MNEIIDKIQRLLDESGCPGMVAMQDDNGSVIRIVTSGCEKPESWLIAILGTDHVANIALPVIGAYCFAKANGLLHFKNASKFAEYMTNCAKVYAQMKGDKNFA